MKSTALLLLAFSSCVTSGAHHFDVTFISEKAPEAKHLYCHKKSPTELECSDLETFLRFLAEQQEAPQPDDTNL